MHICFCCCCFVPLGVRGIFNGAAIVFFSYIGEPI
jgi:hypothetical protein